MYHDENNSRNLYSGDTDQPREQAAPETEPRQDAAPTAQQPLYHSAGGYSFQVRPADETASSYQAQTRQTPPPSGGGKKGGPTWGKIVALCLACTLVGGGIGGAIGTAVTGSVQPTPQPTSPVTNVQTVIPTGTGDEATTTYEDIYTACNPACVAISVSGTTTNIFGQTSRYASAGSGFIISQDGYIVTNHHVISGSDEIEILLSDGTSHDAVLVGSDETMDIALLKVDVQGLPYLAFSDSDQLRVGQSVVAIGNPLGELANTMTTGIISALDREINIDGTVMNVLQTNTAVSPGNSGCPLLDMNGSVIGVINSKSDGTSVEGIGFAIPANDAQKVINDIMQYGYVRGRAALGITVNTQFNSTYARYYNLPEGAYVDSVTAGSAAEKAGLQANDIITKLGDKTITDYSSLRSALLKYSAGESAEITFARAGEEQTATITFDESATIPQGTFSQEE